MKRKNYSKPNNSPNSLELHIKDKETLGVSKENTERSSKDRCGNLQTWEAVTGIILNY